jgi:hypothetical protein
MQDGGGNQNPNAVKYKVPLTTKKASGKTNSSEQEEPEGTRNPISLQLEQECHSLVNKWDAVVLCTLMVVTFHRLTRSLPLDIDAKVSFYNLSPAPTVIAPSPAAVATTATQQPQ